MRGLLSSVIAIATVGCAQAALAQDAPPPGDVQAASPQEGLADIVVTAQRRKERSQEVPIAISAFTAQDLAQQRVDNLADLNSLAPGLRISNADASANPKIFIRGVGLNDNNQTSSSGVGMYVDGVYIGSLLAQLAGFYDLGQVEVLRGPQGTLFGRNTTGGAINITTQQPTFDWRGNFSLDYGRFNQVDAKAGVGGPIIDGLLAFRVAGMVDRDDGHTINRYDGSRTNANDRYAGRVTFLITPGPDTDITISANRFWNRGDARQPKSRPLFPTTAEAAGADGVCAPAYYNSGLCTDAVGYAETDSNPYSINSNLHGLDQIDLWGVSGTINHHFGNVTLTSITAYSDVKRDDVENTDSSPLQMIEIHYISGQHQTSQELRLAGQSSRLNWVVGGYYMNEVVTNDAITDLLRMYRPYFVTPDNPTGASPANNIAVYSDPMRQVTDSYAVFGQVDYKIADKLVLTGGLRWSADHKVFDYVRTVEYADLFTFHDEKTFSDWSGRLGVRYEINPRWNVYATYNRGYKSGGYFGGSADTVEQLEPYRNETVNAYEVGSKTDLFGHKLRVNLSAFYYDYKDIQAYSLVERSGVTVQVLDNAANAKIYGAEAEITAQPTSRLNLSASAGYLHATYGNYVSGADDYSGNIMPHSPKWTFNFGGRYDLPLGGGNVLTPRIDMSYRSKVYFDSTQRARVSDGDSFLLNGEIGWSLPGKHVTLGVWAKNLTDHVYLVGLSPIDSLGVDLMSYAPPRTFGGFVRFNY